MRLGNLRRRHAALHHEAVALDVHHRHLRVAFSLGFHRGRAERCLQRFEAEHGERVHVGALGGLLETLIAEISELQFHALRAALQRQHEYAVLVRLHGRPLRHSLHRHSHKPFARHGIYHAAAKGGGGGGTERGGQHHQNQKNKNFVVSS